MAMREWLESTGGKIAVAVLLLVAAVVGFMAVRNVFGPPPEVAQANKRVFVDIETGKPFTYDLKVGDMFPVRAPSGKQSGYPAEMCWWTRDGKIRTEPFAVVLNEQLGKSEPTFCPDCGRLVVSHNPRPEPGDAPPPTKEGYRPRAGPQTDR